MSKHSDFKVPLNALTAKYRTKFGLDHQVKGSFNHGLLIPFDIIEVLPGDTFKIDVASIIRMSTPIAPIMDNIHMQLDAWFVPNRLVYDNWEQLMGANKTGAWIYDDNEYVVPTMVMEGINPGDLGDYMGLPINISDNPTKVSALPLRAYDLIWNEFYRSQVVSSPIAIDHSSSNAVVVSGETRGASYSGDPLPVGKYADYFTKALPTPIKHDPIPFLPSDLKVGAYLPSDSQATGVAFETGEIPAGKSGFAPLLDNADDEQVVASINADWNTIEALRVAFQLDKFYYKDNFGSRYYEVLENHFAVLNSAGMLQLPQKIGQLKWRINVDQVLSTAGYSASGSTTVGATGANSVTTSKGSLMTFSATEHGYILILGCTRHDHTYGQGFHRHWLRSDRLDFYDPVFANIGEQPVLVSELYGSVDDGEEAVSEKVFGYQEAWAEYRFIPDRVCGVLNPIASPNLDFWTLADKFDTEPLLNETFIYENRDSLSRALVTGANGPDFIFDMYFKVTAVREMPLFSIPGLADHH